MSYVVAIDGPAGAGKSSAAKKLARALGIRCLDTGAIYRAVALDLDRAGIAPGDTDFIESALKCITVELRDGLVLVNGLDVSADIRTPHVDAIVSDYSALPCVRAALLGFQRDQLKYGSLVAEGRDVGSAVFPSAPFKFFLTASPEVRAKRRCLEREAKGEAADYDAILASIKERDRIDSTRETAPLSVAEGAVVVDTSGMTEDEVVKKLEKYVRDAVSASADDQRGEGDVIR